ncbi:MAG: succinate dehydrogenase rane subunit [Dehalococcoidia bacterium]|nr:succinate dehydrogenase rane subunit [Dehalococcoidia bacterium]
MRSKAEAGLLAWILQRVTAVLLFFALGIHLWVIHFVEPGKAITFESVVSRMQNPLLMSVDLTLLAAAMFHGLNGVRIIALDFGIGSRGLRALTWLLVFSGVVGFLFGVNALWPFLFTSGRPLLEEAWWSLIRS